jgi:DNA primase
MVSAATTLAFSLTQFENYDGQPHGNGAEKRFLCPVCGDSKPRNTAHRSMAVNVYTGLYHCHRCHTEGKLKDFWDNHKQPDPKRRVRRALDQAFKLNIQESAPRESTYDWREFFTGSTRLPNTPGASYLDSRGIITDVQSFLCRQCVRYHPRFFFEQRPAVIFSFANRQGEPVAMSARCIDDKPKAHRSLGPKKLGAFYTMPEVWKAPVIVLTEAPMDALSLMTCGVPAVALGGCEWPDWLPVACGLKNVVLAFDNDRAGDNAAARIASAVTPLGAKVARLKPYIGKDWNEVLQHRGIARMSAWLTGQLRGIAIHQWKLKATVLPSRWWPFFNFSSPVITTL